LGHPSDTLSVLDEQDHGEARRPRSSLIFVLCGDDWKRESQRLALPPKREILVGRADEGGFRSGGEIRIPDKTMSRRHARLSPSGRGLVLEDLGSKNGTRVNGERVEGACPLVDGDVLEFGHSFLVFRRQEVPVDGRPAAFSLPRSPVRTLSTAFERTLRQFEKVAPSQIPVLITGESGVGKELVARASHDLSGRKGKFVPVNCGALPEALVEAELFGARKGAFTGADSDRTGLIRAADGGTLFLDELGELPLPAQAKLLRVLQERTVMAVGGTQAVPVDFRLVCATHQDLRSRVAQGAFRGDLYARVLGHRVDVPALRHRREDLGDLVRGFLSAAPAAPESISRALVRKLMLHTWPYNVRELQQSLSVGLRLVDGGVLGTEHVVIEEVRAPSSSKLDAPTDDEIRTRLVELLVQHDGNISQVARSMGKARMQIHRWLKRFAIDPKQPL